jgi:AcrR family transcriptional regulator
MVKNISVRALGKKHQKAVKESGEGSQATVKTSEEKILEAAKKVLFAKGYAGARMQDIADEAGINKALLHYYFRNKDKLFETIFREAIGKLIPGIASAFSDEALQIEDKIRTFCSAYIRLWIAHPYIPMFVLHEMHSGDGEKFKGIMDTYRGHSMKVVLKAFESAMKNKEIRKMDPLQLLLNMISLCIFPFVGSPVFKKVTGVTEKQYEEMLLARVTEVSEFIIESIKYRK